MRGKGLCRHERSAGGGILLPGFVKVVQEVAEGFFKGLSGMLGDDFAGVVRGKVPGLFPGKVQGFAHNLGGVVEGTGTGYGDITQGVVVRRIVLERAVAPAVPAAVVSLVQRYAIEAQEFVGAGAGTRRQAGFCRYGVSFSQGLLQVELPVHGGPHFAHEPGTDAPLAKLELGLVTGLVGG